MVPDPASAPAGATPDAGTSGGAESGAHGAADPGARCAVWNRELSFAGSVATHDEHTFVEHVHAQAMFVEGEKGVTRGRDAVLADWKPIIAGQPVMLFWHPTSVVVADTARSAVSRGPYLIEDPRPNAAARFKKGLFQSVWVKDADGAWRVLVDGGTPPPVAITAEEAERIKADLHAPCAP
jgi:ketosteroid isomerase-like protein